MTEAEYKRLTQRKAGTLETKKGHSGAAKPPKASGHNWELKGIRYECTCCGMGLSLRAYPHWYMGYWTE
jgi:hypothetical protein